MFRTRGRLDWLAAAVLGVCVVGGSAARADGDKADVVAALDKGKALQAKGQYEDALPYFQQAMDLAERVYGKDHKNTAAVMNQLAVLYGELGQYDKAEPLLQRCLQIREDKLGKDDVETAQSLNNLAGHYRVAGQYDKAEPLARRSLEIREAKLGKDHPATADSLNTLALLNEAMGRLDRAEPLFQRSLQIREDKLGKDHVLVAQSLNNLADLYRITARYDKAESLGKRGLQIREDKLGKDHPTVAESLNNLALLYQTMGHYDKAEPLYQRSLQIMEDKLGKNHPRTAVDLTNLADLYRLMGEYQKAESFYQQGLEIRESKLGKDHPAVAGSLNNLGVLYYYMGQYDKAEPLLLRGLRIREDKFGKDHPAVATSLNSLALLNQVMGRYDKAEPLYLRSLRIREDKLGKDHLEVAPSLNNLALLYKGIGQYDKAEPLYQRSFQIYEGKLGKDHPFVALSLTNLADLYMVMSQYDKAEPLYRRGLEIREAALGENNPDVATSLNDLASLYRLRGQYDKAEPLYQRCLRIREDKLGKDHPAVAGSLNNLALLYWVEGQYDKAEPLYRRSLQIKEDKFGKDHPSVAATFQNFVVLDASLGQWRKAAEAEDQARRNVRRNVARLLPTLPEKEQLAFLEHEDAKAFHTAESLALEQRGDAAVAGLSAGWVLNGKAVANEALAQRALEALEARDPTVGELSQQLLGIRRRLAALTEGAAEPGQEDARRRQRDELTAQEKDFAERLRKAGGHITRPDPWVELAEVRKFLPADAVLIEISKFPVRNFEIRIKDKYWQNDHYAAWVIPSEGQAAVQVIDLGPADAIEDAVKAVRQSLKDAQGSPQHPSTITQDGEPDAEKALLKPLKELSRLVLEPLAEQIDGKKRWYVSPDAALWLAPWAALPLKDGRYAVEAHTISYLVSGRDLVAPASQAKAGRPRMMADPNFDLGLDEARVDTEKLVGKTSAPDPALRGLSPSLGRLRAPRLAGTAAEALAVKPALEKYAGESVWLYQQDKALEGVFKTFRGPRVLLLSTHGFFLPRQEVAATGTTDAQDKAPALDKEGKPLQNPLLRCGLLLAGCNNRDQAKDGDEDGVLTGLEVVGVDLRGTELVVLSACETGLGDVHNGEGVAGLRQAFQLAGARSVAATLWQIPDRESAKLMADFFANMAGGKTKADALRDAQLAMIQQRRDKNAAAHPFFWAAFTLTGQ